MSPETMHRLAISALRYAGSSKVGYHFLRKAFPMVSDPVEVCGLSFQNRVGLAAGFDKDITAWKGLSCLGFGHLEFGTITPNAQKGHPKPRIWRFPENQSIKNCMGFPNPGMYEAAKRLAQVRRTLKGTIVGVNIGKGMDTPLTCADVDYSSLIRVLGPHVDYLTMNLSSPNTKSLALLQFDDRLHRTLEKPLLTRDLLSLLESRKIPLFVKISPNMSAEVLLNSVEIMRSYGVDGVIATNTIPLPHNTGGLSGLPLRDPSEHALRVLRERFPDYPVIAVGGIMTPQDGRKRVEMGAQLVQVYTGMVYSGPRFPSQVAKECADV